MTDDLERRLSEHYRRLDPAMAPLSLSERLDEIAATSPARTSRRPILVAAAVLAVSLLGLALVGTRLEHEPPAISASAPPTPVLDGPVLTAAAAIEWVSADGGPFIVSGWITYDGSASCSIGADPDFDDRCPDGWYLVDRDPYGPDAPATRLRLALATEVGTAIIHSEVLLRVEPRHRAPGACPTMRPGCEPLLTVAGILWTDRLAVHVDNRSARAITIEIVGAGLPADGAQTEVILAPSASIDLAAAMTDNWTVEVDGEVVIDSQSGSPAGPILVEIDAAGMVRAGPLVP